MDRDIQFIIDEDRRLARMLDEAKASARERIEQHRRLTEEKKRLELERIQTEFTALTEEKINGIGAARERELEKIRQKNRDLVGNTDLRNKTAGRIVSLLLDNR
ncbi:MAG: hypothetical protein GXY14_02655 [Spirochaetes bacterium]|nr:hypothetical protein [Spirochaetota bacterium]